MGALIEFHVQYPHDIDVLTDFLEVRPLNLHTSTSVSGGPCMS